MARLRAPLHCEHQLIRAVGRPATDRLRRHHEACASLSETPNVPDVGALNGSRPYSYCPRAQAREAGIDPLQLVPPTCHFQHQLAQLRQQHFPNGVGLVIGRTLLRRAPKPSVRNERREDACEADGTCEAFLPLFENDETSTAWAF